MKIFKLVLLTPALISGAFATENSLDQLIQKAVLGFRDVLTEQNRKIAELTDKVSILEQQLQAMNNRVIALESKDRSFVPTMPQTAVRHSGSKPNLDFNTLSTTSVQSGRFTFSKSLKPRSPDTTSTVSSSSSGSSSVSEGVNPGSNTSKDLNSAPNNTQNDNLLIFD